MLHVIQPINLHNRCLKGFTKDGGTVLKLFTTNFNRGKLILLPGRNSFVKDQSFYI